MFTTVCAKKRQPGKKVALLMMVPLAFLTLDCALTATGNNGLAQAQRRSRNRKPAQRAPASRADYSQFSHSTHVTAQKLACDSCHKFPTKNWKDVRKGDAAFPDVADFPEHDACLSCHRTQFFARERPAPAICSNCHVAVTPRDTARFLFPSLGDVTESGLKVREFVREFGVAFPHDKHLDVVGFNLNPVRGGLPAAASGSSPALNRRKAELVQATFQQPKAPPKSCPVCHQVYRPQGNSSEEYLTKPPRDIGDNFWLKKGTFMTSPTSHAACFSCHLEESGLTPEPENCDVCHKLIDHAALKTDFDATLAAKMGADKTMVRAWITRISSGAFRHEAGEHPDLSCLSCHNVEATTFSTFAQITTKVTMRSCGGAGGCHITATTNDGGALNFEIDSRRKDPKFACTKCHVTFGKEPMPASHPQATPTPKQK